MDDDIVALVFPSSWLLSSIKFMANDRILIALGTSELFDPHLRNARYLLKDVWNLHSQ